MMAAYSFGRAYPHERVGGIVPLPTKKRA